MIHLARSWIHVSAIGMRRQLSNSTSRSAAVVDLDAIKKDVRQGETNLGDLFCDAMRIRHETDAAIYNSGGIRGNRIYEAGTLTKRNVTDMHPFGNTVVTIWATGAQLKNYIEQSLGTVESDCFALQCGDFVQVSGFKYAFNATMPVGSRLQSIAWSNGTSMKEGDRFTLALSDYMYSNDFFSDNEFYNMVSVNDAKQLLNDLYAYIPDEEPNCFALEKDGRIERLDQILGLGNDEAMAVLV